MALRMASISLGKEVLADGVLGERRLPRAKFTLAFCAAQL
jgi:hypothetical protein